MLLGILFAVVVSAAHSRKQAPEFSEKCQEEFMSMQTEERYVAITECEKQNGYDKDVIAHLRKGDRSAAISVMEESFQECGKLSKECAEQIAPVIVEEIQLSGEAVSETCQQAWAKVMEDESKMKEVAACEKQGKYAAKVEAALSKDDLDSAMDAAETSLKECWGLSEECAIQIAPVAVGQVGMSSDSPPATDDEPATDNQPSGQPAGNIQPGGRRPVTERERRIFGGFLGVFLDRAHIVQKANHRFMRRKDEKKIHLDSFLTNDAADAPLNSF